MSMCEPSACTCVLIVVLGFATACVWCPRRGVYSWVAVAPWAQVQKEFQEYAQALRRFGVRVVMHSNPIEEGTTDAIFPNNWFSTHRVAGGHQPCMFLYPMKAENRRLERKPRCCAGGFHYCPLLLVGF